MGLIDMIKNIFTGSSGSNLVKLYVKDNKCGNKMDLLLRKSYDIQKVYDENEEAAYQVNKVVICDNCYNKVKINVRFDKNYNIISQEIDNGTFISEEEFNSE